MFSIGVFYENFYFTETPESLLSTTFVITGYLQAYARP